MDLRLLCLVLLTGCATVKLFVPEIADRERQDLVYNFEQYQSMGQVKSKASTDSITVEFDSPKNSVSLLPVSDTTTLGVCYYAINLILLNQDRWPNLSPEGKEIVLFHELGHCLLDRRHTEIPACIEEESLMCERVSTITAHYRVHRTQYLRKFFNIPDSVSDEAIESLRFRGVEASHE